MQLRTILYALKFSYSRLKCNDKSKLYLIVNFRFQWLLEFLDYLKTLKEACNNRPGNFDQNARGKMFISWQTHEGFQLIVYSVIEATQFFLQEGMDFVLTECFCQDALEEYFGHQRKLGRQRIILIFEHLVIITMQSEFKGKCHVKVETPEGEKTGPEPGSKLQMTPFHVKRK